MQVGADSALGATADRIKPGAVPLGDRFARPALVALPAVLTVYLSFQQGGFFPASDAYITLVLALVLLVMTLVGWFPPCRVTRPLLVATGTLSLFAVWTLASAVWSTAPDRAVVSFVRVLLYLLVFLVAAAARLRDVDVKRMAITLAAGIAFVCTISLLSRLLPHVWPTSPGFARDRLSYPVGYWNGLGVLAAIGIVLLVSISADARGNAMTRILAAALVPVLSATLLLTFSRGAIAVAGLGIVVFVLASRSRALLGAALAILPATAAAIVVTYHAGLLASDHPTGPAALVQGRHVAFVVGGCALIAAVLRLLTAPLDSRVGAARLPSFPSSSSRRLFYGLVTAGMATAFVALGGVGWASRQATTFIHGSAIQTTDIRARLTSVSSNNRSDNWRAALRAYAAHPVLGTGAGTYEFSWYQYRQRKDLAVINAHSLYIETLSELGGVGLALLGVSLAIPLAGFFRKLASPCRTIYAGALASGFALLTHAAIDWDWQLPAVTLWFFALGGAAMGSQRRSDRRPRLLTRVTVAGALVVSAVFAAALMLSESDLQQATSAYAAGDCRRATTDARSTLGYFGSLATPDQILGFCALRQGQNRTAVSEMRQAVAKEPTYWVYRLDLAIAYGFSHLDPRPQVRAAIHLAPGDPAVQLMLPVLATHSPRAWASIAHKTALNFDGFIR